MENNIINTLLNQERVTSTYADIYFDDVYCKGKLVLNEKESSREIEPVNDINTEWISPSDLLIGKVELIPPFTSKITRGKTHEGILAIGNEILDKEYKRFLASLTSKLHENDESWKHLLYNERKQITKKVKEIFEGIFHQKCQIMNKELIKFYDSILQDLEGHLQSEVQNVLKSVHANMIIILNNEIPFKLEKERKILENVLINKYNMEMNKIKTYYNLLMDNELYKNHKLINCALRDRNEAIQAFCKQIDFERLTTSMYVMSIERKKCRIKKLFLEKVQTTELSQKLTTIKQRQDVIETFEQKERKISDINKQWEDKIKKLLELFLKFISFSLKLLPEQSTFLLDFQKMVVLQLNELQKQPNLQASQNTSILIDEDNLTNSFEFKSIVPEKQICEVKPFSLIGDLSEPDPPRYGSSETIPSNVDLPFIRVNRQYVYAKCHGYEELQKIFKSQQCQCAHQPLPTSAESLSDSIERDTLPSVSGETISSTETLVFDDMPRLEECPNRKCGYALDKHLFPFLPSYLDFSEKNFVRVKAILGESQTKDKEPELLRVKTIVNSELPFAETKEKYRHAETQYSTHELDVTNINCTCISDHYIEKSKSINEIKHPPSTKLTDIFTKRKASLRRLLDQNPKLLKVFTDESYDFQF